MFVKKFEAPSLEEALKLVKSEMGPEALVLSTQEKRPGKLFSRRVIEVTAAVAQKTANTVQGKISGRPASQSKNPQTRSHSQTAAALESRSASEAASQGFGWETYRKQSHSPAEVKKPQPQRYMDIDADTVTDTAGGSHRISGQSYTPSRSLSTQKTLSNAKLSVKSETQKVEAAFRHLGVSSERSAELAQRIFYELSSSELADTQRVNQAKAKALSHGIRTLSFTEFVKKGSWVPIGCSGVGKTTLLVKLAILAREQQKSVSLISMDNRKISGRGELAHYSRVIHVPFSHEVSKTSAEKLKLIDAPAFNLKHTGHDALEKLCLERSALVVLDATSRLTELMRQVEKAMVFCPEAIAFTKVDNVEERGVIYDVLKNSQLPLLGLSVSSSFKVPFQFITPSEFSQVLIKE